MLTKVALKDSRVHKFMTSRSVKAESCRSLQKITLPCEYLFPGKRHQTKYSPLITARKRSLGQGNMLTGVCLSTGGVVAGPGECMVRGGVCCQGGACSRGGMVPGGGAWWKPSRRLLMRAVRILLECILVMILLAQPYYTIAGPKLTTLNSIEIIVKT